MISTLSTTAGRSLCGLALLLALVALPAWAADEGASTPAAEPAAPAVDQDGFLPVTVAGMQVSVDPETGRLRPPTAAEAKALAAAFQQAYGGAARLSKKTLVRRSGDGMLTAQVDFSLLDHYVAERLPDGTIVSRCVAGPESVHVHDHGAREVK